MFNVRLMQQGVRKFKLESRECSLSGISTRKEGLGKSRTAGPPAKNHALQPDPSDPCPAVVQAGSFLLEWRPKGTSRQRRAIASSSMTRPSDIFPNGLDCSRRYWCLGLEDVVVGSLGGVDQD